MLKKFIFQSIVRMAARRYKVLDPIAFLARLRSFAQPSEVAEPIELLRSGIIFHARGLVNTKAIQNNMDWIWPYWVERQFNPSDASFVPRGFSFSHINLTHRNWTAVTLPNLGYYPIVDPAGLVTPFYDSWSIDVWIITESGRCLFPSKSHGVEQKLLCEEELAINTQLEASGSRLESCVRVVPREQGPTLDMDLRADTDEAGWLVVSLRPYNPEGIQFVDQLSWDQQKNALLVNDQDQIFFSESPQRHCFSNYRKGDVLNRLEEDGLGEDLGITCPIGMGTMAALYPLKPNTSRQLNLSVPLEKSWSPLVKRPHPNPQSSWNQELKGTPELDIPDEKISSLFEISLRNLIMHSADEIFPGPFTYKRFWFRDASLIAHALLVSGRADRVERAIQSFPEKQEKNGYFRSQKGEWDSNGQVLWLLDRFYELTGKDPDADMIQSILRACHWIEGKRIPKDDPDQKHAGLLPAGFSAEHLGPNDYYYWDNLWAVAGLESAAKTLGRCGERSKQKEVDLLAKDFSKSLFKNMDTVPETRYEHAIPAAPTRRMDAGAIGTMVGDYPLQLFPAGDKRIMATLEVLMENCFYEGAFFQDMIHSGLNAYLTLDVAQTLLRAGDRRFMDLMKSVADLASPTGQWPEAIHPQGKGGCMGDGQHVWAAAEWVMMVRNCFVLEDQGTLVLGTGILPEWLKNEGGKIFFGPTPTCWGEVSVEVDNMVLRCHANFSKTPENIVVKVPGFKEESMQPHDLQVELDVLKINFFTNTYHPHVGGVAKSVSTQEEELSKLGHPCLTVAPEFDGYCESNHEVIRVKAIHNFNGTDFSVKLPIFQHLVQALDDFHPDIIHSHHPFLLGDTAYRQSVVRETPLVFTHHTLYEEYTHYVPGDSPALKRLVIDLSTEYANLCDGVFAPSESIRNLITERGVKVPVHVLPTGIDLSFFEKGNAERALTKFKLPHPDSQEPLKPKQRDQVQIIGHVGRLAPEKNLGFLARAIVEYMKKETSPSLFLVVGKGPSQKEMKKIFDDAGLGHRIVFTGVLSGEDLADAYQCMDVFAFTSFSETQGMVLAEAMAAGCPVVAMDASGVREVVKHQHNGVLLSDTSSEQDFSKELSDLMKHEERRSKFKRSALKTAREYAKEKIAREAVSHYENLIGKKAHHSKDLNLLERLRNRISAEFSLLSQKVNASKSLLAPEGQVEPFDAE